MKLFTYKLIVQTYPQETVILTVTPTELQSADKSGFDAFCEATKSCLKKTIKPDDWVVCRVETEDNHLIGKIRNW